MMQKIVASSSTEAELIAATSNAHDMMYLKRLLELFVLKVALPMVLELYNQGAVDLVNDLVWESKLGTWEQGSIICKN